MAEGKSKARDYTSSTIKRLHVLSGNQCAAPDCPRPLIARDGETIISKICHIEAASPKGARWNASMTDDERRHFNNLILLCDECHTIVDNKENEPIYPVTLLKEWKMQHESTMTYKLLAKQPSLLSTVIDKLSNVDLDDCEVATRESLEPFKILEKIEYNDVQRNRVLIDEYSAFYHKLNSVYCTLEEQGSFAKERLLRNVRLCYLNVKGRYVESSADEMSVIRQHADDIFEAVQDELLKLAEAGSDGYPDDIAFGVSIVMVDAFVRCKILEAPLVS